VVKFVLSLTKLRKQLFCEIFKIQEGAKAPLPPLPTAMVRGRLKERTAQKKSLSLTNLFANLIQVIPARTPNIHCGVE